MNPKGALALRTTASSRRGFCASLALALGAAACGLVPAGDARWIALIDAGRGLENWDRLGDAIWRAEDGAVISDSGEGYLVSKRDFRDFRLRAEFFASEDANSGIFLRMSDRRSVTPMNSYEVNIFDRRPDPSYGTGAIVMVAKVAPMPRAGGRWSTYDILAQGPRLIVTLNGRKTVDVEDARFSSGPIGLQSAGGVIKWRKLEVLPL